MTPEFVNVCSNLSSNALMQLRLKAKVENGAYFLVQAASTKARVVCIEAVRLVSLDWEGKEGDPNLEGGGGRVEVETEEEIGQLEDRGRAGERRHWPRLLGGRMRRGQDPHRAKSFFASYPSSADFGTKPKRIHIVMMGKTLML